MTTNSENKPIQTPTTTQVTANTTAAQQSFAPAKTLEPVKAPQSTAALNVLSEKATATESQAVKNNPIKRKANKPRVAKAVKKAATEVAAKTKAAAPKTPRVKILAPAKSKTTTRKAKKPVAAKAASNAVNQDFANLNFMEMPEFFKAQMENINKGLFPKAFELGNLNVANLEISELLEAQRDAAAASLAKLNQEMEKFFETTVSKSISAGNELMHVKTLPELIEMQAKLAQNSIEACIEHSRQLGAIANAATLDAFRPLNIGWGDMTTGFFKKAS